MAWHPLDASAPRQGCGRLRDQGSGLGRLGRGPRAAPLLLELLRPNLGLRTRRGYYAYIWTDKLQQNVYDCFESHGGMTCANGQRFRTLVLSQGHSQDYSMMFRNILGHDPEVEPLLVKRGLVT